MSFIAYRNLLYEITRQLDHHDYRLMIEICELEDEVNDIRDARSFIRKLEEKKHLTIDLLGDLEEVLESLEELSLQGKLKKFENKRKEYKSLLLQISRALDCDERNHLERLIDICRRETSVDFGGNIVNVGALLKNLKAAYSWDFVILTF